MNLIEKATLLHYHRHRIAVCAAGTVGALGWRGEESQRKRFEVIARAGDLNGSSLLDVGCGHGDLKRYLDPIFTGFTYVGIDQMPEFIAEARARYGAFPRTYFYQTDFTTITFPQVDYVIASGALGYRCADPDFYFDMIRKMAGAAKKAVVFNMLDAARFPSHPLLVGHDFEKVAAFCRTLSSDVRIVRGYLEDDFTVFIRRPSGGESHVLLDL